MADTRRLGLRRAWFQIHKWIGIILVVLLIPLSLTGSALVWDGWLDAKINPQRYAVSGRQSDLPPSAYAAAARARLKPGDRIGAIRFSEDNGPIVVTAVHPRDGGAAPRPGPAPRVTLWLDPADARVLDVADGNSGLLRWVHNFHGSLTVPGVGRQIVGWLGVAMLLSALTGLWLWWPTVGRFTRGLRWSRARDWETNLHHQVGFWIALPLAMLSLTGAWISFPTFFAALGGGARQARDGAPGGGADRFRASPLAATNGTPDEALALVRTQAPGAPVSIAWPTDRSPEWRITVAAPGQQPADYTIDDETGEIEKARERGNGGIARLMRRLHDGTGMGPVWQTIIFLAGLAPAILGVTGIVMWLRTRRWRGDVARKRRGRTAVPAE